jgi:hypothetical protein
VLVTPAFTSSLFANLVGNNRPARGDEHFASLVRDGEDATVFARHATLQTVPFAMVLFG